MELDRMESFLSDKLTLLEFTEKQGEDELSAFRSRFRNGEFSKQERRAILQRIHHSQSILWREMALLRNQREEVMDYMQSYGGRMEEAYTTTMSKGLIGYVHDFTTPRLDHESRKIQRRHAKLSQELFKTDVENYYCPGRDRDFYNWCPVTRGFVESDFHLAAARIIPREISGKVVLGALRQRNVLEDGNEILQNPENAMMMFRDVAKAFSQGRFVIVPFTGDAEVSVVAEVALRKQNLAHMRREECHINSVHLRSIHSENMEAYRISSAARVAEARRQAAAAAMPSSSSKPRAPRYKAVVLDQTLIDNPNPDRRVDSLFSLESNSFSSEEAGGGRTSWAAIHNSELIFPPGSRWPAARNLFFHFIITILRREFHGQNDQHTLEAIKGAWTPSSGSYFRLSVLRHWVRLIGVSNELQEHALDWEKGCFDEDVTLPEIDDADLAAKEVASSLLAQMSRLSGAEDEEVEEGYYSDFSD